MIEGFRPCPFCGDVGELALGYDVKTDIHMVVCIRCGCEGPSADSADEATERWNTRHEDVEPLPPPFQAWDEGSA